MKREFHPSYGLVDRWQSKSRVELFKAIGLIIAGACFIYGFTDDEVTRTVANDLDIDKDLVELIGIFIACAAFMGGIISAIITGLCRRKVTALQMSFVALEENGVRGTMHTKDIDRGIVFSLPYEKIRSASGSSGNDLNLSIYTYNKTYRCLGIPNAPNVAALINEECAKRKDPKTPDSTAQQNGDSNENAVTIQNAQYMGLVCPDCAKPIPGEQKFCGFCGAEGVRAKGKVVTPILINGRITCPECGQSGQRLNRRCCIQCGILFLDDGGTKS